MDCSPPGSSVHGNFQARVLEWGATAFSGSLVQGLTWRSPHGPVGGGPDLFPLSPAPVCVVLKGRPRGWFLDPKAERGASLAALTRSLLALRLDLAHRSMVIALGQVALVPCLSTQLEGQENQKTLPTALPPHPPPLYRSFFPQILMERLLCD